MLLSPTVLQSLYLSMGGFRLSFTCEILKRSFRNDACIQELLVTQNNIFLLT